MIALAYAVPTGVIAGWTGVLDMILTPAKVSQVGETHTCAYTHTHTRYIYLQPKFGFETLKRWISLECGYLFYLVVGCKFYRRFNYIVLFELLVLLFTGAKSRELRQTSQSSLG